MRKLLGIMAEQGLSGRQLAKKIGMSANTFYNRVNGKSPFDTVEINEICKCLNITDEKLKAIIFLTGNTQ